MELFSLVSTGIASVIAIAATARVTARRVAHWAIGRKSPPVEPLDPDGEDANWEL